MLELNNIRAGYGKKQILKGASLTVPKGKLVTVIGPNGSGKSTLFKSAAGIIPTLSGEVLIDEVNARNLSRSETAKKTAYLAQGKSVPDMTVFQLVLHGRFPHLSYPRRYTENDKKLALEAIEKTGLAERAESPISSLSGGMRQNAYIAMALAQNTDYILLDEPTTYLDISHQLSLMKTLRELVREGKGVAAVLHDLPLAFAFSDIIAVLNGGEITACGEPLKICESGIISEVFGTKLKYSHADKCYYYKY